MHYEMLKHTGEFPIVGVNTFLNKKGSPTVLPAEIIRATADEKEYQIEMLERLHKAKGKLNEEMISALQEAAVQNENIFDVLMEAAKHCSLGQITNALFEVGGQYRRNM
jgi:methylmalonyl-CoA mutase